MARLTPEQIDEIFVRNSYQYMTTSHGIEEVKLTRCGFLDSAAAIRRAALDEAIAELQRHIAIYEDLANRYIDENMNPVSALNYASAVDSSCSALRALKEKTNV